MSFESSRWYLTYVILLSGGPGFFVGLISMFLVQTSLPEGDRAGTLVRECAFALLGGFCGGVVGFGLFAESLGLTG